MNEEKQKEIRGIKIQWGFVGIATGLAFFVGMVVNAFVRPLKSEYVTRHDFNYFWYIWTDYIRLPSLSF